jgi:1,4-alpha-glucan branching enzyme
MLYLDYAQGRRWIPNRFGGRENLEAIDFLRTLNERSTPRIRRHDDRRRIDRVADGIAPDISRRTGIRLQVEHGLDARHAGDYMSRKIRSIAAHHNQITFSLLYAFSENFVLPLSHDEVVYGKGSMIRKMPGDDWQKFANLRLLYGYMFGHPARSCCSWATISASGTNGITIPAWIGTCSNRIRGTAAAAMGARPEHLDARRAGALRTGFRPGGVRMDRLQ